MPGAVLVKRRSSTPRSIINPATSGQPEADRRDIRTGRSVLFIVAMVALVKAIKSLPAKKSRSRLCTASASRARRPSLPVSSPRLSHEHGHVIDANAVRVQHAQSIGVQLRGADRRVVILPPQTPRASAIRPSPPSTSARTGAQGHPQMASQLNDEGRTRKLPSPRSALTATAPDRLTGRQKVAILCTALGAEHAAKITADSSRKRRKSGAGDRRSSERVRSRTVEASSRNGSSSRWASIR